MGTQKQENVRKLTDFCAERGFVIVEVANNKVDIDAMKPLKAALRQSDPVSVKLRKIDGGDVFNDSLYLKNYEKGNFTVVVDSSKTEGVISRFPTKGFELSGKHILLPDKDDSDEFSELKSNLLGR